MRTPTVTWTGTISGHGLHAAATAAPKGTAATPRSISPAGR